MTNTIPLDLIKQLLKEDQKPTAKYTPQRGPLRYVDNTLRCASKGCSSPTYIKIDHIPYCGTHALHKLNEMVLVLTDRLDNYYKGVKMSDDQGTNDETEAGNAGNAGTDNNEEVQNEEVPENASSAEPGNQSDEDVAEILENEDDGA